MAIFIPCHHSNPKLSKRIFRYYNVIIIRETVHHNMQYLYVFPSKNANAVEDQPMICKSNKTAVNIKAKAVLSWSFQTFIPKDLWKYTA